MLDRGMRDLVVWHVGLILILMDLDSGLEDGLVCEIRGAARRSVRVIITIRAGGTTLLRLTVSG